MHNVAAARRHMQLTDLVVVWGSGLTILANYFDPWHPDSKWARPPPHGVRLAPPPQESVTDAAPTGNKDGKAAKRRRGKGSSAKTSPCRLAIITRGKALDEELAAVKMSADVDKVMPRLLRALGLPDPPEYVAEADPLLGAAEAPHAGEPDAPWRIAPS